MEEVLNLINICPTNPIQILNKHDFFQDVCVSFKWYFWCKKNVDVGIGAPQQRQEVY